MADKKDNKVDNSIIESQVKQESLTGEDSSNDSSMFGKFDNKYVKGAIAAIIAAYAAKKDPYMLKGFSEKVDELAKADRANRSKYIEASATGIGKVLAENAARRKERITDFSDKINQLTVYTKDKYKAASMVKSGLYSKMLSLAVGGSDINSLYKVTTEFDGDKGNLSTAQLAELLAGPTQRLDEKFTQFNAPKKFNPIGAFIGGTDKEDVTSEVMSQTKALAPEAYADSDSDVENVITQADLAGGLTDKGTRFLRTNISGSMTETAAKKQVMDVIAKSLGGEVKVSKGDSGELIYSYDSEIQSRVANAGSLHGNVLLEVENLMQKTGTGEGYTRREAVQDVINKYKLGSKDTTYEPIRKALGKNKNTLNPKDVNTSKKKNLVMGAANVLSKIVSNYNKAKQKNTTIKIIKGKRTPVVDAKAMSVPLANAVAQGISALTKPNQMFEKDRAGAEAYVRKQLGL
jgi:hypothetical protein